MRETQGEFRDPIEQNGRRRQPTLREWLNEDGETHTESVLPSEERLSVVKKLRLVSGKENGDVFRKHFLEYREANPSPYGVTLGIEIEIPDASVLPEGEALNGGQKKKYLHELKEKYEETERMGISAGKDQFWEFAHAPSHNPTTLAREVEALIGMKLIDADFRKFPLHITIGGITFKGEKKTENNAHLLARVLDATAWETDGDRLLSPYTDPKNSDWTMHDSKSGIRERKAGQILQSPDKTIETAVELRTSQMQSLFGLDRYLTSAYYLGSALRAYQHPDSKDPVSKALGKVWRQFAGKCENRFEEEGLLTPLEVWEMDNQIPEERSWFKNLAEILKKGLSEPKSPEAKFIHDIRALVISARAEAKEIIEKTRN